MADTPKLNPSDRSVEAYEKINQSIEHANEAKNESSQANTTADGAKQIAESSNTKSLSTQEQLDQVVIEGDSSVEAAQARVDTDGVSHQTLKERLDDEHTEVTTQLADKAEQSELDITNQNVSNLAVEKADQSYVDTQFSNIVDGSPKGTYATLTDLQNAYPSGTEGVYVVSGDGNWYYWDGSAWVSGGTYQSTGTAEKSIESKALSDKLQNFIDFGLTWEVGGLDTSGNKVATTNRIRTEMVRLDVGSSIELLDDTGTFNYAYHKYSLVDQSSLQDYGWRTETNTVDEDAYYIIVIKRVDEADLPATQGKNVSVYGNKSLLNIKEKRIGDKQVSARKLSDDLQKKLWFQLDWELGSVDPSGDDISENTRIRTDRFSITDNTMIELKDKYNYRYAVRTIDESGTQINDSGWLTDDTLLSNNNYEYILLIKQRDSEDLSNVIQETSKKILITNVDSLISKTDEISNYELTWELGSVDTSGTLINATNRIRTKPTFFKVGTTLELLDKNNYHQALELYSETGAGLENYPWVKVDRTVNVEGYYRVVLKKSDETDFTNIAQESGNLIAYDNGKLLSKIQKQSGIKNTLDSTVKAVLHRGYSLLSPENTLPAFKMAKERGFSYVECDIRFTSDDVPVLIHDTTIDRTSDGTGEIASLTLTQVKAYDFGSWKSSGYVGTEIPTLKEFILLCKKLNLHPYIELKSATTSQIQIAYDIVKNVGMANKVTWIGGIAPLEDIVTLNPESRVAVVTGSLSDSTINLMVGLKTGQNEVVADASHSIINEADSEKTIDAGLALECYTVNDPSVVLSLSDLGVTGFTTDYLNVAEILESNT